MGLPADKYPTVYFYDLSMRKAVKINAAKTKVTLKNGSTKGRGPGQYFSMSARTASGRKLYKFMSEKNYDRMQAAMSKAARAPASARRSRCNTLPSGKRRTRAACMKSPRCSWVSGRRTASGRVARRSYCRRS